MNRELKVLMFAALAILMASACVMIADSDDSDAASVSISAKDLYEGNGTTSYSSSTTVTITTVTNSGFMYYASPSSFTLSGSNTSQSVTVTKENMNTGSCPTRTVTFSYTGAVEYTYYLQYDLKGGSGGPSTQSGTTTASLYKFTIPNTTPTKSGYTFKGWSTSASATSVNKNPGDTMSVSRYADDCVGVLYAVWEQNVTSYTCYLYYNANGGSGAPSTQSYTGTSTSSHSFTVSSTTPTKSGYTFLGWSTSSSASSASYSAGSSISVSYNGSKTLYAVWQSNAPATYTVTVYKGNWDSFKWVSGSDTTKYTSSSHTYTVTAGSSFDIDWYGKSSESGSGTGYTYTTSYTSSNYNMATSQYGTSLGDSVTINSSGSYYPAAQMTSTTTYTYSYTITYNANGGSGAPSDTTTTDPSTSKSITLSSTTPTRSGYTFLGWSTSSSATSASYSAGSSYTFNYGTTNLYAVWKQATITVTGTPDSYGVVGTSWSFKPTVSVDGCSVTISGASWLSSNGTNVSGTPTSPGTYNVTLTFSKTGYTSATKSFTVTVLSALSFESSPTGGAIIYAV